MTDRPLLRRALAPLAAAALAGAASACAPNPIIARDPIPAYPGLAYTCASRDVAFGQFYTSTCRPAPPPPAVVVRAKG